MGVLYGRLVKGVAEPQLSAAEVLHDRKGLRGRLREGGFAVIAVVCNVAIGVWEGLVGHARFLRDTDTDTGARRFFYEPEKVMLCTSE